MKYINMKRNWIRLNSQRASHGCLYSLALSDNPLQGVERLPMTANGKPHVWSDVKPDVSWVGRNVACLVRFLGACMQLSGQNMVICSVTPLVGPTCIYAVR